MADADLPTLTPVESSSVKAVGHRDGSLYVEFPNGALWRFADVPVDIMDEMLGSGSIGRYLRQFIITNHPGEKIRGATSRQ